MRNRHLLAVQAALVLAAPLLATAAPARTGPHLLLPVAAAPDAAAALAGPELRLVGRGPLPGSLWVDGDGVAALPAALGHGVLLLAADAPACRLAESLAR